MEDSRPHGIEEEVPVLFMGTYTPKLDEKGRLFLPAKFRDRLAEGVVVTRGQESASSCGPTTSSTRGREGRGPADDHARRPRLPAHVLLRRRAGRARQAGPDRHPRRCCGPTPASSATSSSSASWTASRSGTPPAGRTTPAAARPEVRRPRRGAAAPTAARTTAHHPHHRTSRTTTPQRSAGPGLGPLPRTSGTPSPVPDGATSGHLPRSQASLPHGRERPETWPCEAPHHPSTTHATETWGRHR